MTETIASLKRERDKYFESSTRNKVIAEERGEEIDRLRNRIENLENRLSIVRTDLAREKEMAPK